MDEMIVGEEFVDDQKKPFTLEQVLWGMVILAGFGSMFLPIICAITFFTSSPLPAIDEETAHAMIERARIAGEDYTRGRNTAMAMSSKMWAELKADSRAKAGR